MKYRLMSTALGGDGATGNGGSTSGAGAATSNAGSGQTTGAAGASGTSTGGTAATGGTSTGSWRDSLPDDIKSNAAISSYSDIAALAKSHIHAQSQLGKKGAIVPGEKSSPEDWNAFYKAIGVPEADKYTINPPKDVSIDAEVLNQFKSEASKNGLLPKQAEAVLNWYMGLDQAADQAAEAEHKASVQEGLNGLKQEWGEGYDTQLRGAQMAVKELGGDDLIKYLNESGVGNDPMIIKAFAKASKLFGEDKLRESGVTDGRLTADGINEKISELRAKGNENGFYDKNHPGHTHTMNQFESLMKQLTGGR